MKKIGLIVLLSTIVLGGITLGNTSVQASTVSTNKTASVMAVSRNHRTLRFGSTGDDVKEIQEKLFMAGFYDGIQSDYYKAVDGKFGNDTENAVKKFQGWCGLNKDGVVGSATWHEFDILVL